MQLKLDNGLKDKAWVNMSSKSIKTKTELNCNTD